VATDCVIASRHLSRAGRTIGLWDNVDRRCLGFSLNVHCKPLIRYALADFIATMELENGQSKTNVLANTQP